MNWTPAPCLDWHSRTRLAGAVAGAFTSVGGMDPLLDRIGAFSRYGLIRYWSDARHDWRPVAREAGLVGDTRSPADTNLFAASFIPGRVYTYFQVDAEGRRTTYRLTVRERSADRVILAIENVSAIHFAFFPLFDPGALQSVIFLERRGPSSWRYFQAVRATDGVSLVALSDSAAYTNRLTAFYRYVTGSIRSREEANHR